MSIPAGRGARTTLIRGAVSARTTSACANSNAGNPPAHRALIGGARCARVSTNMSAANLSTIAAYSSRLSPCEGPPLHYGVCSNSGSGSPLKSSFCDVGRLCGSTPSVYTPNRGVCPVIGRFPCLVVPNAVPSGGRLGRVGPSHSGLARFGLEPSGLGRLAPRKVSASSAVRAGPVRCALGFATARAAPTLLHGLLSSGLLTSRRLPSLVGGNLVPGSSSIRSFSHSAFRQARAGARRRPGSSPAPARSHTQQWSRNTARVLTLVLRNQAPLPWSALARFAEMPPEPGDVLQLLPLLEKRALQECDRDPEGVRAVGQFAFRLGVVARLSAPFAARWVHELATSDVFAALQVYKTAGSLPLHVGVDLYLRAGQPRRAAELAREMAFVPPPARRRLIEAFVRDGDMAAAQAWIDGWQAMLPGDVRWLHQLANQHDAAGLQLPELPQTAVVSGRRVRIGEGLQHLVSKLNAIVVAAPDLLAAAPVHTAWIASITGPSRASLEALAVAIARQLAQDRATTGSTGPAVDWLPILRLVSADCGYEILRAWPQLSARAFAAVIARTPPGRLAPLLELMAPETFYQPECLHAVARADPALFAELTVPEPLLETALTDHHLISLWRAESEPEWLFALTLRSTSPRVLRAALRALVAGGDRARARELLTAFVVTQRQALDPKVLKLGSGKLAAGGPSGASDEEAWRTVDMAMAQLFE